MVARINSLSLLVTTPYLCLCVYIPLDTCSLVAIQLLARYSSVNPILNATTHTQQGARLEIR
jgi:hypothetical protein